MSTGLQPWLARHLWVPLHSRWEGNAYASEWRRLESSQWSSGETLRELREERLKKLLRFIHEEVPFYRGRVSIDVDPWEALSRLPVIDKGMLQEEEGSFRSGEPWASRAMPNATGGSTGQPLRFLVDPERWGTRKAATLRHNAWAGLVPGTSVLVLWGQPSDFPKTTWKDSLRSLLLERAVYVNASSLSEEALENAVELLRRRRIRLLQAYSGALGLFAQYLAQKDIQDLSLDAVVSSAEMLAPGTREQVRERLGAPIFDRYGCREFSVIASECDAHAGMHVNAEHLIVEILVGDRPARPGEIGEVVVTDLLNRAQPFVRYRMGDLATPIAERCSCGRGLPRLELVGGRKTDFIVTPTKGWVSGVSLATYLITNLPGVAHVRLEQNQRDKVRIRARATAGASLPVEELRARSSRMLGEDMGIELVEDPTLRPEGSGKFRFSVSDFSPLGVPVSKIEPASNPDRVAVPEPRT